MAQFSDKARDIEPFGHDRDEPACVAEATQCRAQVSCATVAIVTPLRTKRKRRVHQHDIRRNARIEHLVDQFAIVTRNHCFGKQAGESGGALAGELVEYEPCVGFLRPEGQQAGARRRLEDRVALAKYAGARGEPGKPGRRCELL